MKAFPGARWGVLCCIWLVLSLGACGRSVPVTQEAFVFGTRVELQVAGVAEAEGHAALGEVLREFDRLHRTYHAWKPSELTALNEALAAGRTHPVAAELAQLLRNAQVLSQRGDRLFDPALGKLIALWGFHSDEFHPVLPDPAALQALVAARPSSADLVIDGATVRAENPAVALDFGGYLKGVALDRAAALLKARGIRNALINIGGNVLAMGDKGERQAWRVGIRHPRPEQSGGSVLAALELRDGEAIGTSGDYQRFFEIDGRRYSHLIDPRTGAPAVGSQAVTVLIPPGADAGMRSDALTKPLFIAGDRWPELARRLEVERVLRIAADGAIEATPEMAERLRFPANRPAVKLMQ